MEEIPILGIIFGKRQDGTREDQGH